MGPRKRLGVGLLILEDIFFLWNWWIILMGDNNLLHKFEKLSSMEYQHEALSFALEYFPKIFVFHKNSEFASW